MRRIRSSVAFLPAVAALSAIAFVGPAGSAHGAALPSSSKAAPPKSWRLAFQQVFSGTAINKHIWGTCYPWEHPSGCTNYGNTSDPELEWYQPSQIQVKKGVLNLVAQREPTSGLGSDGHPKEYDCRSGMITSFPSMRFKYGFVQITARIPFSKGLWSAFWLGAANEKWPPEIDILEHWGTQRYFRAFFHPVGLPEQQALYNLPKNGEKAWHTFMLYWTSTRLTWYFDGHRVYTTTKGIPTQSMYLISNLAVDDASPGGCSGALTVKSVKIWVPRT